MNRRALLQSPWHLARAAGRLGQGALDDLFPSLLRGGLAAAAEAGWKIDLPGAYCPRCGAGVGPGEATAQGCSHCAGQHLPWDRVIRLGPYRPPLDEWIPAMKFHRAWVWGPWLGRQLAAQIEPPEGADSGQLPGEPGRATSAGDAGPAPSPGEPIRTAVCPVPMHWWRRIRRGYNQAHLMARAFAQARGWPLAPVLQRRRLTAPQTSIPPSRRPENIRGSFAIEKVDLAGCQVWLIDDVKTTGATLTACARLLKRAGANKVYVAVAAVAEAR